MTVNHTRYETGKLAVRVLGSGRDHSQKLYIRIKVTYEGRSLKKMVSMDDLMDGGRGIISDLADSGIPMITNAQRTGIQREIQCSLGRHPDYATNHSFLVADRFGWRGDGFVGPHQVHTAPGSTPIRLSRRVTLAKDLKADDEKRATRSLRRFGNKNPLVQFAVCAAFVGPLIRLLNLEMPWFVFVGDSSSGKSKLFALVASIFGGKPKGRLGLRHSLSGTTNGLESGLAKLNDMIVCFDDTQQLPTDQRKRAQELNDLVFRAVTGRERARSGQGEAGAEWRAIFILGANESPAETLKRGEAQYGDFTSVRVLELPAHRTFGIFDRVPAGVSVAEFSKQMEARAGKMVGVLGNLYLARLVSEAASDSDGLVKWLRKREVTAKRVLGLSEASGTMARVADHFAAVYAAGRLAQKYGVVPWRATDLRKMLRAIYEAYATQREILRPRDAAEQLWAYLRRCDDKVAVVRERDRRSAVLPKPDCLAVRYEATNGNVEFWFTPDQMRKAFGDHAAAKAAVKGLRREGHLICDEGKMQTKRGLPGNQRERVYCTSPAFMTATKTTSP